jgi:hypothetical protein
VAVILAASACAGLISAARSSGTITEGTSTIALAEDLIQSDPIPALVAPAGMALQVGGSAAGSNSRRLRHTPAGTSRRTRYLFRGRPEVQRVREEFGIEQLAKVGDRGMMGQKAIEELRETPAHSFATLMADLATIVRNTCRTPQAGTQAPSFEFTSTPSVKQRQALELIQQIQL